MRFYFHPLADTEFDEAIRYYEQCEPGLGLELAEEVYSAIRRVSDCDAQAVRFGRCNAERYGNTQHVRRANAFVGVHDRPTTFFGW
jgi:hypothetical protein